MKKIFNPKCRLCWDKGYSTEYVGSSYAMPDFHGDKEYKVADEGIVKHYCTCEKGREMNPNRNSLESIREDIYFSRVSAEDVITTASEAIFDRKRDDDLKSKGVTTSEYLTDEEYERMKKDVENHITGAGKKMSNPSKLDELISKVREEYQLSHGITNPDFIEYAMRLAVQKHAEAVIPEKPSNFFLSCKGTLDKINQASDKWRGVK